MKQRWHDGNRLMLLQDGDEFFPRVFEKIREAREEVLLETFILSDDKVGRGLRAELIAAAERGVRISITVDGFGSPGLEGEFIDGLTSAGVNFHIFNPGFTLFGFRTNWFRRLHRKIIVIDRKLAYIGGINFIADQLSDFGPEAKRDYAVEIEGPVVGDIHAFARRSLERPHIGRYRWSARPDESSAAKRGGARILFVTRDNRRARTNIERHYQLAIRRAQHELIIANAYFFPGYRLLWRLRQAARRGVDVSLILQGRPDIGLVKWASSQLYHYLLGSGVKIYEYCERPLHGKVAIADNEWATVGSSNLDPLSLSLNLEANVVVLDEEFNRTLRARLADLMDNQCQMVQPDAGEMGRSHWWRAPMSALVFHVVRNFPNWAGWLPRHTIVLKKVKSEVVQRADDSGATASETIA